MQSRISPGRLAGSLVISLIPGYIALYLFTSSLTDWYPSLVKPPEIPSDLMVFYGIILMFLFLALTLYTVWNGGLAEHDLKIAVLLFVFTLTLTVVWFIVFFYVQFVFFGLMVMVMAVAATLCTLIQVLRSRVVAAVFLVPFLLLLLFAGYGNLMVYLLNPGLTT